MLKPAFRIVAIRGHVIAPLVVLALACFACDDDGATSRNDAGVGRESADGGSLAADSGVQAAGRGGSRAAAESGGGGTKAGADGKGDAGDEASCEASDADAGPAGGSSEQVETVRGTAQAEQSPKIDDAAYQKLIAQLNKFGLDLGRKQAELNMLTESNSVYSPLSASIALSMTYAGARTTTADAFSTVLGGGIAAEVHHAGINRLIRQLASRVRSEQVAPCDVRKIELNIADRVYVDKALSLQPEFLDQLSRNYDIGVHAEDFRHAYEPARLRINDWVAAETRDRIKNLLKPDDLNELTRLVLVNALYFYGSWATPFVKEATRDEDFHTLAGKTIKAPTMHSFGSLRYSQGDGFAAVELPYVGQELQMFLVLPNKGQFETVRDAASAEWLETASDSAEPRNVSLALPKFEMTVRFALTQALKDLGLGTAFTWLEADFTGITEDEPLFITKVIQKAFIKVDEKGTEAAAATAVILATGSAAPTDIVPFIIDRPFLFFIRDLSGAVLFSGQVVDPSRKD
jgi:serpin B